MKIQVLGSGCESCNRLYENVLAALKAVSPPMDVQVEHVRDIDQFLKLGVFVTPALVIDGKAVSPGKVLSVEEIALKLQELGAA
ncbi:MAG: thioredoxin family protein [Syntrophobacteraceae bacterium]|nr:thioredoxin family protein [Desulfobacteraceae bacterium]